MDRKTLSLKIILSMTNLKKCPDVGATKELAILSAYKLLCSELNIQDPPKLYHGEFLSRLNAQTHVSTLSSIELVELIARYGYDNNLTDNFIDKLLIYVRGTIITNIAYEFLDNERLQPFLEIYPELNYTSTFFDLLKSKDHEAAKIPSGIHVEAASRYAALCLLCSIVTGTTAHVTDARQFVGSDIIAAMDWVDNNLDLLPNIAKNLSSIGNIGNSLAHAAYTDIFKLQMELNLLGGEVKQLVPLFK